MKIEDYKGYEIRVDSEGVFQALKEGNVELSDEKLKDLKKRIDEIQKKCVRRPVIYKGGIWGGERHFREAEVTSIVVRKGSYGYKHYDAWIVWREKGSKYPNKEKVSLGHLLKPTEENKKII